MKKTIDLQLLSIFGGGLLFNFLFWNEGLGLNLLLHSLFILIVLFIEKKHRTNKKTIFFAISHLLAALLVVINHSVLNIFGYYITLIVFIGFAHAIKIRSVFTAMASGVLQLASSPINLVKKLINVKIGNVSVKPILRPLKYIIIPVAVVIFFSIIYSIANPVFAKYGELLITNIYDFISDIFAFIFGDLSFARFLHVILGLLFTAGMLLAFKENTLEKIDAEASEILIRKRKAKNSTTFIDELKMIFIGSIINKKMALKTENIIGIISFAALNLLLLSLNAIDIYTLWLGKLGNLVGKNYSAELHEGTNALIVSIFMAMAVILYFFYGNINFFSKNKTIKYLAYLWIVQNSFLICSVLLRDYNYIAMHGLTYKRIGVIVFLILCTIGLITVYIKVAKQKTFFYLCKKNGFIWYIILVVSGIINWDVFIVNYNIENRKNIVLDFDHLLSMSDKTLPLLDKNRKLLTPYIPKNYDSNTFTETVVIDSVATVVAVAEADTNTTSAKPAVDTAKLELENNLKQIEAFNYNLNNRIERFKTRQKENSWLSWNYRDWQTMQYFSSKRED